MQTRWLHFIAVFIVESCGAGHNEVYFFSLEHALMHHDKRYSGEFTS